MVVLMQANKPLDQTYANNNNRLHYRQF